MVLFYGSFAATYQGHGTDVAIIGGLLDYQTDNPRIPRALEAAEESGMAIAFREGKGLFSHPNTAKLILSSGDGEDQEELTMTGVSIGGGNIEIIAIDGFTVRMSGNYPTIAVRHKDWTGIIASVSDVMRRHACNIAHMTVDRKARSGDALTVLELDGDLDEALLRELSALDNVEAIRQVDLSKG
ncbi:L-serine dehydratase [Paenibacillus phyllosphaerae]|uniref:L-serine deaminase n=1 Tax=Paenibacillus phyllosphaerae TaxID=274593 RepID=A0A7W5FN80_9BACL|nr:L-serine dehydratase [Paenibacillus phyllosphaerae]